MSIQDNLLKEFPQHSAQEWKEKLNKDLKTKTFDDLTHKDSSGLSHRAFYTQQDIDSVLIDSIQNVQKQGLDWLILENMPSIQDSVLSSIKKENLKKELENGFDINGLYYKDSGATIVNELLAIMQHLMTHLELASKQELDLNKLMSKAVIYVGSGLSYFSEIAKYRALRFLVQQILHQYNISKTPKIVGIVSPFYYSHKDAHTNLLRATSMGMSAVLGGVDELYVSPFDYPIDSEKGKRWAANIQRILKHESHFEKILDPAAGSYYIENLSSQIVGIVWEKLKDIEGKGGMLSLHEKGQWFSIFEEDFSKLIEEFKSNSKTMIGVNKYLNDNGIHIAENKKSISNSISA